MVEIPQQRLPVEEIARNEQTVYIPKLRLGNDFGEGFLDGLGAGAAPGLVTVRCHTPVDISSVKEFHGNRSPLWERQLRQGSSCRLL